ncbi:aromatase/cyclase [Streptomyces sp. NPDC053542]|uniref:aromatase/cyclase n=1 Tax=Streptomyces sp. NPDC053542 TaxID=3365710 RepID=UPI0037D0B44B
MTLTQVTHSAEVSAPASEVYRIISDVTSWPLHFPPTLHAERIAAEGDTERIRIWALANGEPRTWVSTRRLDPRGLVIEFAQTEPRDPVAAMSGTWRITERTDGTCTVRLDHAYRAVGDAPEALERIARAVDTNSEAELASLKRAAESAADFPVLHLEFEDSEVIAGSPAEAYDFLCDAARWADRLSHVERIVLKEETPGLQFMEMDTRSPDGSVHTTTSGRVCVPTSRIVYKQVRLPKVLRSHTGEWRFEALPAGRVQVTSRHSVIIDPEAVAALPDPPPSLDAARAAVRNALGANSRATLATAKAHIESR